MSRKGKPVVVHDLEGNILERFETVHAVARHYNVLHPNVLYWIRNNRVRDGKVFSFENESDYEHHTRYNLYHPIKHFEDAELDRDSYKIVPYEVKFMRVSITPCPYKDFPKPMVGSMGCQACRYFKGLDKKNT